MDLLSGSSSSSDENEDDEEQKTVKRSTAASISTRSTAPGGSYAGDSSFQRHNNYNSNSGKLIAPQQKGRKVLQLTSILPPHIVEQLTRQVPARAGRQGIENNDDDDEEDDDMARRVAPPNTVDVLDKGRHLRNNQSSRKVSGDIQRLTNRDAGIVDLLSELQSATKQTKSISHQNQTSSRDGTSQPIGMALVQTTTYTTTAEIIGNNGNRSMTGPRDIHGDPFHDRPGGASSRITTDQNLIVENEQEQSTPVVMDMNTTSAPHSRPVVRRMNAAPPMGSKNDCNIRDSGSSWMGGTASPNRSSADLDTTPNDDDPPLHQQEGEEETVEGVSASRKRTRRAMEQALRRGDFSTALKEQQVAALEQVEPNAYQPLPETYAVPRHGIKVVPTAMYDPKGGVASVNAAGKGRGKNQIHHLMASAANLELERTRIPNKADAGKAHRANARQKYGW